jgi:hypothetical protein
MITRPVPGTITVNDVRVRICNKCGCFINDLGCCSCGCENNYDYGDEDIIIAVYRRTEEFLRDE